MRAISIQDNQCPRQRDNWRLKYCLLERAERLRPSVMRIAWREHQQPSLSLAPDEHETIFRYAFRPPSFALESLDSYRHCAGKVAGWPQALAFDHLPVQVPQHDVARRRCCVEGRKCIAAHAVILLSRAGRCPSSSRGGLTLYKMGSGVNAGSDEWTRTPAVHSIMGFRFYRRIKILPGVRINLSRSGISTSIGVRGAHVTRGKTGTRTTVGLPGSGLSYTHLEKPRQTAADAPGQAQPPTVPGTYCRQVGRGAGGCGRCCCSVCSRILCDRRRDRHS